MANHFRVDRAIGNGCHSEIRNVNGIRKRVDFLFWYHCDGCFICLWVHKIRDRIFKHQFQMAYGYTLCVWMSGIGFLYPWLQKPPLADAFVIASLLPVASAILGSSFLMSAYPF